MIKKVIVGCMAESAVSVTREPDSVILTWEIYSTPITSRVFLCLWIALLSNINLLYVPMSCLGTYYAIASKTSNTSYLYFYHTHYINDCGSDSSGGTGIQADIKTISYWWLCVSIITAVTSQNTLGVTAVMPIPLTHIENQIDAVFNDLNVIAVKVGMLTDTKTIELVAKKLNQYQPQHIVIDPVMVATSGDVLMAENAIVSLIDPVTNRNGDHTNLAEAAALIAEKTPHTCQKFNQMLDKLTSFP